MTDSVSIASPQALNPSFGNDLPGRPNPDHIVSGGSLVLDGIGRDTFITSSDGVRSIVEVGPKKAIDNIEKLKESGVVGAFFADIYEIAIDEEPLLQNITVITGGASVDEMLAHTGGYVKHKGESVSGEYEIIINTEDGPEHYETLLATRRASAEISAIKMGIDPALLTPKQLAAFIFLHELGHIVDYEKNVPDFVACKARRALELAAGIAVVVAALVVLGIEVVARRAAALQVVAADTVAEVVPVDTEDFGVVDIGPALVADIVDAWVVVAPVGTAVVVAALAAVVEPAVAVQSPLPLARH